MKKLTFTLIAIAIATVTFSQSFSINGGISIINDDDDSFEPGLSLGLKADLFNFNIGEIPFYIPIEVQYSAQKAWKGEEKYSTSDFGTGFCYDTKYAELGIIGGINFNSLPNYAESDGFYLTTIEYDLAMGYYFGVNAIVKYPFSDQFAVFLQGRYNYKSFKSDYSLLYYDINENLITEAGTTKYNLSQSIISLGLKVTL